MPSSTELLLHEAAIFAADWSDGDLGIATERMSDAELLQALDDGFALKRRVEAMLARLAGQLADRSRPSLGAAGLAVRTGSGSTPMLLSDIGRISRAEAGRLCRVGVAISTRVGILCERLPALYPMIASAEHHGERDETLPARTRSARICFS